MEAVTRESLLCWPDVQTCMQHGGLPCDGRLVLVLLCLLLNVVQRACMCRAAAWCCLRPADYCYQATRCHPVRNSIDHASRLHALRLLLLLTCCLLGQEANWPCCC